MLSAVDMFAHDVHQALRALRRQPGFALVAVATLALGIAGTTALFGTASAALLRPLPFADESRLVRIYQVPEGRSDRISLRPLTFLEIQARASAFESIVAQRFTDLTLTTADGPERVVGIAVGPGWAKTLGVVPALGRAFTPEEEAAGEQAPAVIVSHALWKGLLGSERSALGRTLIVNDRPRQVVGVMPAGFAYPYEAALWLPLVVERESSRPWAFNVPARIRRGVSLEEANADLRRVAATLAREYPDAHRGATLRAFPVRETLVGDEGPALVALVGAVGFLLLIVCANLANLLLARGVGRRRELAVRAALGASRARQVRLLLAESLLLAGAGGLLGVALAAPASLLLVDLLPGALRTVLAGVAFDGRVLAFAAGVSVLAGLLFGLAPALHAGGVDLREALATGGRSSAASQGGLLGGFAVSQVALALLLLAGAGVMLRNLARLESADLGYAPERITTFSVSLDRPAYAGGAARTAFVRALEERLEAVPGVSGAGASNIFPSANGNTLARIAPDDRPADPERQLLVNHRIVTPGFLRALDLRLLRGRLLKATDTAESEPVAVVSRAFADRYWPGQDPLGRHLRNLRADASADVAVVGVVEDVREFDGIAETWYRPFAQEADSGFAGRVTFAIRTSREPAGLVPSVRATLASVDPTLPLYDVETAAALYAEGLAPRRLGTALVGAFAGLGLLIAALGLYGVLAYSLAQRRREIGVRIAVGATPRRVLGEALAHGLRLVALGTLLGLAGALALGRVLGRLVSEVEPHDPLALGMAAALLGLVGLVAALLPAQRATRIDPVVALREE